MYIIYSIRNTINDKRYIGRTSKSFDSRYYKGMWWRYTCSPSLRAAAKKYGKDAFEVSIIYKTTSLPECIEKEIEMIKTFRSLIQAGIMLLTQLEFLEGALDT